MRVRVVLRFALVLCFVNAAGCRHRRADNATPSDPSLGYGLGSRDAHNRKEAAEYLRKNDGPPADAVPMLVDALARETDRGAKEEMLMTLGASGAPEAKPAIDAHLDDTDADVRRTAHKAEKRWETKNGHAVRRDVETVSASTPASATPSASAAAPPAPDGCTQFKDICATDPFNADACRTNLAPLAVAQQQVWADCVNDSKLACQPASDACMIKAKSAK